ncbi:MULTISPECIES: hypothetical protein [unclassified Streptomyces]|uniref:hypothetical protein n=1 Tax=unclassified Streptomyces TaxID=2593676 RepID=UPI000939529B|nr:hypothetical protein [Streptomyces sp. CB02009]OKJ60356.1 hypothetical protein AMK27_23425 [Streptomyces sp. CB02009]
MVVQLRNGRPGTRGSGAFAVTAVLVGSLVGTAAVSGCAAPEDPRPTVDPALAVRNAPDALTKAGTSKASTSMEMAAGGTRVTIRGEGGYDFRRRTGRLQVVLPKDPAGTSAHRPITELLTPGALYMKNRGAGVPADKWVRVDTTTLDDGNLVTGGATDPAAAAELLRGARQVTYVGEVELAGVKVSHYRGVADIAHAARVAAPQLRGALAAAAKGFTTDTVPFDAYLDGEGRLRKVRHQFSFSNQGRTVAVASTTLLYGFGVPVQVTLPDRRDIYAGKIKA